MKELMTSQFLKRTRTGSLMAVLTVLTVYCAWALVRPLPALQPTKLNLQLKNTNAPIALNWPASSQAAVGIVPAGVMAMRGEQTAVPIASTAKVLTALAVLQKHPLGLKQSGPLITITAADVAIYNQYIAGDGSVTPVTVGEKLSQYQMLQALLLPSANNIADTMAIWAFGSLANYSTFSNNYIRQLGLTHTRVGTDASGYSPTTVSTAHDLVLLGQAAMQEPVVAEIVGQPSANLPLAGLVRNVNGLLGTNGIIGVKTGNTDEAGGVFIAAQQTTIGGRKQVLISAIVGANSLYDALIGSVPLLNSEQNNYSATEVLRAKTKVGTYQVPWGKPINAVTDQPLSTVARNNTIVHAEVQLKELRAAEVQGSRVGTVRTLQSVTSTSKSTSVVLSESVPKPSLLWRLTNPL
ncbi:D-alanyl-D-alanine carboxypeptidase [Polaromonas sp.]|nr:D-alanyl-D-alanine carboxypeptidase [Candidatus Saccharibacteria bacterium]